MTVDIPDEIRQAIDRENGAPVYLVDEEKGTTYVVLPADAYQRYQALFESEEFDISETYAVQDKAADVAWSDPEDAAYDDYDAHHHDAHRPKP